MSESYASEVQAELQQYLSSKNINSLFISIVENLLIEKPSNPIAYIIEYLHKNYPDQSNVAIENIIRSSSVKAVNKQISPRPDVVTQNDPPPKEPIREPSQRIEATTTTTENNETTSLSNGTTTNQISSSNLVSAREKSSARDDKISARENSARVNISEKDNSIHNSSRISVREDKESLPPPTEIKHENSTNSINRSINNIPTSSTTQENDSDEEEDEDDIIGEGKHTHHSTTTSGTETPNSFNSFRKRRQSVSAESTDTSHLQSTNIAVVPKTEDVIENLFIVISKSPLLRALDHEQKERIVNAFAGPIVKKAGENIIVRGDIGETFYLLEKGEVDVYVKNRRSSSDTKEDLVGDSVNLGGINSNNSSNNNDDIKVHTYVEGSSFGELALMYNTPRAATCRAKTDCILWTLDRISFKAIVVSATMQKRAQYETFLKQVPTLQSLTDMEIMTLADSLNEEKFQSNDIICQQGDSGDYFYIIKKGQAICTQSDPEVNNGDDVIVANLSDGDYFGEIALLTTKPRQATVKAVSDIKVLSIDRATFNRVFGVMESILERNMVNYNSSKDLLLSGGGGGASSSPNDIALSSTSAAD